MSSFPPPPPPQDHSLQDPSSNPTSSSRTIPHAQDGHESCQESLLSRSLRRYQRLPHTGSEICVTTFFPSASLSWLRRVEGAGEGDGEEEEGRRGGAWA